MVCGVCVELRPSTVILIYVAVLIVRSAMAYRDLLMKLLDFGG